jgi:hypothetical protein
MATNTKLPLDSIAVDRDLQQRDELDQSTIDRYAELMQGGTRLPPVQVVSDGASRWLTDGFHRYHAAKNLGKSRIDAEVTEGDYVAAMHAAARANADHGLPRRDGDRLRAAMLEIRASYLTNPKKRPTFKAIRTAVRVGDSAVNDAFARLEAEGVVFTTKDARGGRRASFAPMEQKSEHESVPDKTESWTGASNSSPARQVEAAPENSRKHPGNSGSSRVTDRKPEPALASRTARRNHASSNGIGDGDSWAPIKKVIAILDAYLDDNARDDVHMAVVFAIQQMHSDTERIRITHVLETWGTDLTKAAAMLRAHEAEGAAPPRVAA